MNTAVVKSTKPKVRHTVKQFVLKAESDLTQLTIHLFKHYPAAANNKMPLYVTVTDKPEDRSKAQNKLYWMWLTQYGNHFGHDKEEVHYDMKKRFLTRIFFRDSKDPESKFSEQYAKTWEAIGAVKMAECDQWKILAHGVIDATSTRDADVEQFTEYLNEILNFARKHGCHLKIPDDLRYSIEDTWR
jgi:hypothetical protein